MIFFMGPHVWREWNNGKLSVYSSLCFMCELRVIPRIAKPSSLNVQIHKNNKTGVLFQIKNPPLAKKNKKTSMHSSRMRTVRSSSHVYPSIPSTGGMYPSMHWAGGVSQHALGRGCIPACTGQGGVYPKGVSSHRDVCPGGCVSQHALRQTPPPRGQNSWHTPVKILPCRNFVADGKN